MYTTVATTAYTTWRLPKKYVQLQLQPSYVSFSPPSVKGPTACTCAAQTDGLLREGENPPASDCGPCMNCVQTFPRASGSSRRLRSGKSPKRRGRPLKSFASNAERTCRPTTGSCGQPHPHTESSMCLNTSGSKSAKNTRKTIDPPAAANLSVCITMHVGIFKGLSSALGVRQVVRGVLTCSILQMHWTCI